jgi:hypothetical protein
MSIWKQHLGRRALVSNSVLSDDYCSECVIVEVSPSDKRVKLRWASGIATWNPCDGYRLVELLDSQGSAPP